MAGALGTVRSESIRFRESAASVAGTFTGTFEVPAGAILIDVIVHSVALWTAATSATLNVGDSVTPGGIFTTVNLKATDLLAGESLSVGLSGGKYGADVTPNDGTGATLILSASGKLRRRALVSQVARNLQATVATVGAVGTAGITDVVFVYSYPNPITPSFA